MKIGILTMHNSPNFGAVLQCFALCKTLKNIGHSPMLIDRIQDGLVIPKLSLKKKINHILKPYPFIFFRNKYLKPTTERINNSKDMALLEKYNFDAIIVGSDQVWRKEYSQVGYNYFLDFADNKVRKIAYAASFGKKEWTCDSDTTDKIRNLVARFTAVSLRKESGITICKDILGYSETTFVLDPTLLLTKSEYKKYLPITDKKNNQIVTYILDETEKTRFLVDSVNKKVSLPINDLFVNRNLQISEWASNIANAEYVLTDSYHGMIFSIIFNKQFIVLGNKDRGLDRFVSLLRLLDLENRLLIDDISESKIDFLLNDIIEYQTVNKIIETKRIASIEFLKNSLD